MALTNIWYKILNLLYVKEKSTHKELMVATDCSVQTVKKNIYLLNERLKGSACIKSEGHVSRLEIYNLSDFQKIMEGSLWGEVDFNSSHKRISHIIKSLLGEKEFVIIDNLAEDLSVSRGTVVKDIKELKEMIKRYGISLVGITNKGLQLKGDELKYRLLMQHHLYDYYKEKFALKEETYDFIEKIKKQYRLDTNTGTLFETSTAISIERIRKGYYIKNKIPLYINYERDAEIMLGFKKHLEYCYDISLNETDFGFIIYPVNTRTTAYVESEKMAAYEEDIYNIFVEMIEAIRVKLSIEIDEIELFEQLKYHLMFMMNRLIFHISVFDILSEEIQKSYPLAYELVKIAANVLEKRLGIEVNYIEMSYLAIYFETSIHSLINTGDKKIAVICSTGIGTANLIKKKLKEVLDFNVDIYQYSETEISDVDFYDFFAIFTTVPITVDYNIPVIRVTSLFDTNNIEEKVTSIHNEQILMNNEIDFSFLKLSDNKNYVQNVLDMVETLVEKAKLHPNFFHALQEREKKQTTIFDAGIALPHAVNEDHHKIVFSMGVFPNGIIEKDKEVRIVFLMGIPEEMTDESNVILMKLYDFIFHMAKKKDIYQKLIEIKDETDFIRFIRKGVL